MRKMTLKLTFAILCLLQITANAQVFVKVTDSPLTQPMEAIGASWGDYDDDGDLDVFVNAFAPSETNLHGYGRLYQNNCNGDFKQLTSLPGGILEDKGNWACGVSWIDYDNDGDIDMYTTHNDGRPSSLYENNGNGTFTKIENNSIVNFAGPFRGHVWADFDNNGFLDLFLSNDTQSQKDKLFFNEGNDVFTEITSGVVVNDFARSENADVADIDNDGDLDLFVATNNSYNNSFFYRNIGNRSFEKILEPYFTSKFYAGYSLSLVDIDNDLDIDFFHHGAHGKPSRLYRNQGDGTFIEQTNNPVTLTNRNNNGGETWGDYDNDGDLDLFVSDFYKNQFFNNDGNGNFSLITNEIVTNDVVAEAYGATWADFDKDGDLDLFVPNAFGNPDNFFYINTYQNTGNSNHWIDIKCKGEQTNKSAIGARIYVKAILNGVSKWQMREINANHNTVQGGQNPINQHFGLAESTIIDSLKIYWPTSGITQIFTNVTPDRYIEIIEGDNNIYNGKECVSEFVPKRNVKILKGRAYYDRNENCQFDSISEWPLVNKLIELQPSGYYVQTDNNGFYEFRVPNDKNYTLKQYDLLPFSEVCTEIYNIDANVDSVINLDFPNKALTITETGECGFYGGVPVFIAGRGNICRPAVITTPCPTFRNQYLFPFIPDPDNAVVLDNVSYVIRLDPGTSFEAVMFNPCNFTLVQTTEQTIFGPQDVLTFTNIGDINPGQDCSIRIRVLANNFNGAWVNSFTFNVHHDAFNLEDADPDNNIIEWSCFSTFVLSEDAECSCDPNDKTGLPKGCGNENKIAKDSLINYTVRFQNIGTLPAHNVVLKDYLDENLDLSTLQVLSTSHKLTFKEILPNNVLNFYFDNIELPDSISDEEGSMGFIVFRIAPKKNLPDGTIINNFADIFFDNNFPVRTNTVKYTLYDNILPDADFDYDRNCSSILNKYNFQYIGSSLDNLTFKWEFEDAFPLISTYQNPQDVIFNSSGVKKVKLIVNENGCINEIVKEIIVSDYNVGNNKIKVCHNNHVIEISKNALPAHLAHGDCIGECTTNIDKKISKFENEIYESSFELYPNPANESVKIKYSLIEGTDLISIQIYNLLGEMIDIVKLNPIDKENTFEYNLSLYNPGIYTFVIRSNETTSITKIIKY